MAQAPIVTNGDDIALVQDLYENGTLVDLSAATIYAAIQDSFGNQIIASRQQSSSASGAAWGAGRVVCEFPSSVTASLPRGDAWLEVEVTRSGKKTTWPLFSIEIQSGSI